MAVPEICEWKSEHARLLERKRAAVTQPFTRDYNIWPGFASLSFFFPFFLSGIISHKFRFFDQRRIVVYTHTYIYMNSLFIRLSFLGLSTGVSVNQLE